MVARTPSTVFYTGVIRFSVRIGHRRSPSKSPSYLKKTHHGKNGHSHRPGYVRLEDGSLGRKANVLPD